MLSKLLWEMQVSDLGMTTQASSREHHDGDNDLVEGSESLNTKCWLVRVQERQNGKKQTPKEISLDMFSHVSRNMSGKHLMEKVTEFKVT